MRGRSLAWPHGAGADPGTFGQVRGVAGTSRAGGLVGNSNPICHAPLTPAQASGIILVADDRGSVVTLEHIWAPWRMKYVAGTPVEGCILCQKASAEDAQAEHVLYRGKFNYVILNAFPYNSGHLMVVPYQHTGDLCELDEQTVCEMMHLAQAAIRALRRCMRPEGMNVGMNMGKAGGAGIDEHVHLHVLPRWVGDTNFMTSVAQTRVVPQSLDETACQLRPLLAEEAHRRGV